MCQVLAPETSEPGPSKMPCTPACFCTPLHGVNVPAGQAFVGVPLQGFQPNSCATIPHSTLSPKPISPC